MNKQLKQINDAPAEIAFRHFLDCCGSRQWAQKMVAARPFATADEMLDRAGKIWQNLDTEDWLEAFSAHPKIGARQAVSHQSAQSAQWSRGEQSGTQTAGESLLEALNEVNRLYEDKFGFIFIVCATGKSAEEMLSICRERAKNEAGTEIQIAADEQRKITKIRLKKLLEIE